MHTALECQRQVLPPFVSLGKPSEIDLWCLLFNCTEDELRQAVSFAGKSSGAIELFLLYRRLTRKI